MNNMTFQDIEQNLCKYRRPETDVLFKVKVVMETNTVQ